MRINQRERLDAESTGEREAKLQWMQELSQLEREKVGSVQRMRINQSEILAAESTEAGKRGQATADARQTSCRVSWREKS